MELQNKATTSRLAATICTMASLLIGTDGVSRDQPRRCKDLKAVQHANYGCFSVI